MFSNDMFIHKKSIVRKDERQTWKADQDAGISRMKKKPDSLIEYVKKVGKNERKRKKEELG